jgi:hypothetical protein
MALGEGNTPVKLWKWLSTSQLIGLWWFSWVPPSSALLLMLALVVASLLWFREKALCKAPYADEVVHPNILARNTVSVSLLENISPQGLQTVESQSEIKATLAENTLPISTMPESSTVASETMAGPPVPVPATDDSARSSPTKAKKVEKLKKKKTMM